MKVRTRRENFLQITSYSTQLVQSADGMSDLMSTNLKEIDSQNRECMKVAQSATQLEQAAHEVARNASETAVQTREANAMSTVLVEAESSKEALSETMEIMRKIIPDE